MPERETHPNKQQKTITEKTVLEESRAWDEISKVTVREIRWQMQKVLGAESTQVKEF